ncbi:hypothetical protein J2W28_005941 [Variovorax boronicumulans]|uniref:hypothetical protein n=1 Tax=Variovorax boronicumulans TaxID=436515 RepID=UPI0027898FC7|nr:hypothetical protein [Variovorax boronicumulans]MDP9995767.1 hypothetical protein [Variovorax boronicumulans]MDQ0006768.1 hypothetical protein [Variovorax boronicumulans]
MNRTRIQIAKPDIVRHFDALPSRVLKAKDIHDVLADQRNFWRLTQTTTAEKFIEFLLKHSKLELCEFEFPQRTERCYVWNSAPLLAILQGLKKDLHFSHYTAMRVHGLTEQTPKTIYLTEERTGASMGSAQLTQEAIDAAFRKPARTSNNWVERDGKRIYLLNGAATKHLGVVDEWMTDDRGEAVRTKLTGLERTLIDVTVKPAYGGGVFEVLKAYELARDRLSVNKLMAMLRKLEFLYPYHQAIGCYLQRAGYKRSQLELVKRQPMTHDFYLAHDMGDMRYDPEWRLHVPNGF